MEQETCDLDIRRKGLLECLLGKRWRMIGGRGRNLSCNYGKLKAEGKADRAQQPGAIRQKISLFKTGPIRLGRRVPIPGICDGPPSLGFSGGANSKSSSHIHQVDEGGGVHLFHDLASMRLDSDLTDT